MGEIHPHRREFSENGIGALWGSLQEFWPQSQWLIGGMAHAEHPLIASHGSHTASHLIGEGLESQSVVGGRQGRGDAIGGTLRLKLSEKAVDGLFEAAVEQMFEAGKRDQTCMARGAEFWWKVKPLEGRQKEQGPHPLVQILGLSAEPVQGRAGVQQLSQCGRPGPSLQGTVPHGGLRRRNEVDERVDGHDDVTFPEGLPIRQRSGPWVSAAGRSN